MLKACRREMRNVFVLHRIAFRTELLNRYRHIHRVPGDDSIGEQIETPGLVGLFFLLLATNRALVGKEEELTQRMEGFAFVELGVDAPSVGLILQIAQDKDGLNQSAIIR